MVLAYLFLALAGLVTVIIPPIGHSFRDLRGPDSAMAGLIFFIVCAPRWFFLAVALMIAVKRGGFDWINKNGVAAALPILAVHAIAGVVSIAALLSLRSEGALAEAGMWIFSVVIPGAMILLCAFALHPPAAGLHLALRGLAIAIAVATAGGAAVAYRRDAQLRAEAAEHFAQLEREERDLLDKRLAELNALTDASPLADWLPFLDDHREAVWEPAVRRVAARPTLVADLTAMLGDERRVAALRYMWLRMPRPPKELAAPTLAAIPPLIERSRAYLAADGEPYDPDIDTACEAVVVLAYHFRESGLDFRAPIQAWLDALNEKPLDSTYLGRSYLEGWLARQDSSPPPNVVMPPG